MKQNNDSDGSFNHGRKKLHKSKPERTTIGN